MGLELKIANSYGSIDVRYKLAKSYVHVRGKRLQPLCRKLGIKHAEALVGFSERGRKARFGYHLEFDGVVVSARSAPKLLHAVEQREMRAMARPRKSPEQVAAARHRRHQRAVSAFAAAIKEKLPGCSDTEVQQIAAHACAVGSGRVGRTSTLTTDEKVHLAVVAHVRHCHTDYEQLLDGFSDEEDRSDARDCVSGQIDTVLERWRAGG